MEIENAATFNLAVSQGINLFLGAGFSVLAKNTRGVSLPIGRELADELVDQFNLPGLVTLSLPRLCTVIESRNKIALRDYLKKRFSIGSFDPIYLNLDKIHVTS